MSDVIYALATPPGKSGVAVVRLSGEDALQIANDLCGDITKPRHVYYRSILASDETIIDDAVVLYFAAPASFTGEDVIELQIHGGRAVIAAVLSRISEFSNTRVAESGEFTRRALENGKLDMLQVEALGDFIEADTELQRKTSLLGLRGTSGSWVSELRDKLVEAMSLVTASIDFSDEDLPENLKNSISYAISNTHSALSRQLDLSQRQQSLRDGFKIAIVGKPNVGKSSLINVLAGRDIAIATDVPGTTRDVLEVFLDIKGLPILLYDTAGLRDTDDHVESIGVDRARSAAENADMRLFLFENPSEIEELGIIKHDHDLVIQAKSDVYGENGLAISTKTEQGIASLLDQIYNHFEDITRESGYFSHQRQINSLFTALESLSDARNFFDQGEASFDFLAESLRQSVFSLDRLIGKVDVEDMLDVIFSKFCIGK